MRSSLDAFSDDVRINIREGEFTFVVEDDSEDRNLVTLANPVHALHEISIALSV